MDHDHSRHGRTSRSGSVKLAMRTKPARPLEPRGHWTLQLLDELVVLGLVPKASTETVHEALKKTASTCGRGGRHLMHPPYPNGEYNGE